MHSSILVSKQLTSNPIRCWPVDISWCAAQPRILDQFRPHQQSFPMVALLRPFDCAWRVAFRLRLHYYHLARCSFSLLTVYTIVLMRWLYGYQRTHKVGSSAQEGPSLAFFKQRRCGRACFRPLNRHLLTQHSVLSVSQGFRTCDLVLSGVSCLSREEIRPQLRFFIALSRRPTTLPECGPSPPVDASSPQVPCYPSLVNSRRQLL